MNYYRGAERSVFALEGSISLLALPSRLEANPYVRNHQIGYRDFDLDLPDSPNLPMSVVAGGFYSRAINNVDAQALIVTSDSRVSEQRGLLVRKEQGLKLTQATQRRIIGLRLQVALSTATFEAQPSITDLVKGRIEFRHFYTVSRTNLDDKSEEFFRRNEEDRLIAVMDMSLEALEQAKYFGDSKDRFSLVGDIKTNNLPEIRSRFVIDPAWQLLYDVAEREET